MTNSVIGCVALAVLLTLGNGADAQDRALSPSTSQATKKRIHDATGAQSEVDSNLTVDAERPKVEPARALLNALGTMVPVEIAGTELEAPLLEVAQTFLAGRLPEAKTKLDELRGSNPQLPPSFLLVAGMLFAAGNGNQGRLWLEEAALNFPDYPSVYTGFARIALTEKRITDAIALLEKSQRVFDSGTWSDDQAKLFRMEFLDGLTDVAINRQKLEEARQHLLELETLQPSNPRIPLRLAQVEFDLDQLPKALDYLNRTRELTPNLRRPEVIISDWLLRKGELDQSEQWIERAAKDFADDANVQLDYGKWLLRNERLPQATQALAQAEKLGANEYIVTFLKGQVAFARRAYDVAEMHFQELNSLRPGDGDATNMLSLSLIESADTEKQYKALEIATINQRVYPRSPTAMATLGWINYRLGRTAEAEAAFKQIASLNNLEPAAAYFVAHYLGQSGNYSPAINLLKSALQADAYFMFRSSANELLAGFEAKLAEQTDSQNADDTGQKNESDDNTDPDK